MPIGQEEHQGQQQPTRMGEVGNRFAERLAAERGEPVGNGEERKPEEPILGDPQGDDPNVGNEDGTDDPSMGDGEEFEQPDQGDAEGDDDQPLETKYQELEERYSNLEKEHSRLTAHRKAVEQHLEDASAAATERVQEAEQTLTQAKQMAQYFVNLSSNNIQQIHMQMQNPNLPPDQHQQLYRQLNEAQQSAQHFGNAMQHVAEAERRAMVEAKNREARVTDQRMSARYSDWESERKPALKALAVESGWSSEEADQITDLRTIALLNRVLDGQKAASAVTPPVTKRKKQPPRSRNVSTQPRDAQGRFQQQRQAFFNDVKPGTKGAAASMFAERLKAEREGR